MAEPELEEGWPELINLREPSPGANGLMGVAGDEEGAHELARKMLGNTGVLMGSEKGASGFVPLHKVGFRLTSSIIT